MFCPNCGTENADTNKFCVKCGTALGDQLPQSATGQSALNVPPSIPPPALTPGTQPSGLPMVQGAQPYYVQRPLKDRSLALILEILPGLFGFLGFGWIYSGNASTGIVWLIGFLIWDVVEIIIDVLTGGLGCFCTLPIDIIFIAVSVKSLSDYTRRHPELFG